MSIPIISAGLKLFQTAGELFGNWQKRKLIKSQGKVDIERTKVEGEIKRMATLEEGEINYDVSAQEGMRFSWKDEWWTVLLSIPFIMCFIPPTQEYVARGFEVLRDSTPLWYQWAFLGAIVASFGLKTWFKNKQL